MCHVALLLTALATQRTHPEGGTGRNHSTPHFFRSCCVWARSRIPVRSVLQGNVKAHARLFRANPVRASPVAIYP